MVASSGYSPRLMTLFSLLSTGSTNVRMSLEEDKFLASLQKEGDENYKQIITPIIAHYLAKLVLRNNEVAKLTGRSSCLDAAEAPDISIADYLERIVKYTPCSKECYYVACIYIDRIIENNDLLVTSLNVHRLLITSIMIASKLLDDHTYGNKYYSHVAGVAVKEMNNLEVKLLGLLRYNLTVNTDTFECYRYETERRCIVEVMRSAEYDVHDEDNLSPNASSEDDSSSDEEERRITTIPASHPKSVLGMAKKKLRRSKSFSVVDTTCFPRTHRRKRSSSFHIEIQPLTVIA